MDGRKVQGRGVEEDRGCRGAVGTVPVGGGQATWESGSSGSHFVGICRSFTNSVAAASLASARLPSYHIGMSRGRSYNKAYLVQ